MAMDYIGWTAGLTARDESFEFRPHVRRLQPPSVLADAAASGDAWERMLAFIAKRPSA